MNTVILAEVNSDRAASYRAEFDGLGRAEVYEIVRTAWGLTVDNWLRMAFGLQRLEEMGDDLTEAREFLSRTTIDWLRRIASGSVLPEVVVRFHSNDKLMKRIAALPVPDQRRLVNGETVKVRVPGDGETTTLQLKPEEIAKQGLINQVFSSGRILSEPEQNSYQADQRIKASLPTTAKFGPFLIDMEAGTWTFTGPKNSSGDGAILLAAARALKKGRRQVVAR